MFEYSPDDGVGYGRVSTKRQSKFSGNGLATQKRDVKVIADQFGIPIGPWFEEVGCSLEYSLRKRPMLWKAVELAYVEDRLLVVPDLSRISRDEGVIKEIFELGVQVFASDLGRVLDLDDAIKITRRNRRTHRAKNIGIKEAISRRRKAGDLIGNPHMAEIAAIGTKAYGEKVRKFRAALKPHIKHALLQMQSKGMRKINWNELARYLNASGHLSIRAKAWTGSTIRSTTKAILMEARVTSGPKST
jgi:DNA invertase Pin-like site-specific DNA recombinase